MSIVCIRAATSLPFLYERNAQECSIENKNTHLIPFFMDEEESLLTKVKIISNQNVCVKTEQNLERKFDFASELNISFVSRTNGIKGAL